MVEYVTAAQFQRIGRTRVGISDKDAIDFFSNSLNIVDNIHISKGKH